ncbi:hypothetical protein PsYK624_137370 [Phanerochaete sordida]|uniref:Uncharacterized protein n=1 Tax=Phanerochaete sordida TaxID=48140 RepID=A0A9P3GMK3_9APHY|nr:hypothetical protein PsYK624_137370 [Phanerochaete sordida]
MQAPDIHRTGCRRQKPNRCASGHVEQVLSWIGCGDDMTCTATLSGPALSFMLGDTYTATLEIRSSHSTCTQECIKGCRYCYHRFAAGEAQLR